MSNTVENTGRLESQWDQATIQRNVQNNEGAFAVTMPLAPTALLPASWQFASFPGIYCYIFKLGFSTDTAIPWTLAQGGGVGGYTAFPIVNLGQTAGAANFNPQGLVVAPPALTNLLDSGFAAAGSYTDLCAGKWLSLRSNQNLWLYTSASAANCAVTIWWAEYTD
jgi:hypothetical protein